MTDWAMEGVISLEERELQSLQEKYKLVVTFAESMKAQLSNTENDLQKARNEILQLSITSEAIKSANESLQHENKSLANDKVELAEMLEREKEKVSRLKETVSNIESFNSQSKASTLNSSALNDMKLKEIELQYKEKRFNSERNFYNEQIKQMGDELEVKNAELIELRKKLNISTMQANLKLEQQSAEITTCHLENDRLKAIVENNQAAHAELKKKYSELEAHCASFESNFSKEIEAQSEVINMLMKQTEDLKSQISARDDEIKILRDISKKGVEAHEELETRFNEMKDSYIKDVAELEAERNRLLEELEKLKQETSVAKENLTKRCIENEFQKAFPLVYENSLQLNSVVSLSDIYQQMTRLKHEKDTLIARNAMMSAHIEEMEAKINDNKPVMYRSMQNYQQLAESYAKLEKNLLSLMSEKQSLVDARDHDTRQIHSLQREVKRYEVECNNFSIQIQHLMKSLVEAQEGISITDYADHSGEEHNENSGPIPANMITFRDIRSCQEQNRNLMRYIHSLVEGDEAALKNEEKLASLSNELENCKQEVERLQNELAQRNMPDGSIQGPHGDLTLDAENQALRAKVDKYQQDLEVCRQQHLEQVRRLDADKNNLISENVTFKSQITKLSDDLEEKVLLLKNTNITMEKLEQENNDLRERNIKLNSSIEHLEKSIIYVKSELEAVKQALKDAESKAAVSRSERDALKIGELTLIQENAQIREDLENQKRMVYQLQAIQANNQESEKESVYSLQMQCENLKTSIEFYREKAASDEVKWTSSITAFSNQINNLQTMLEKEKNSNVEWLQKYFEVQRQLNQQLEKRAVFAQQASSSDSSNFTPSAYQKRQIALLEDEIKVLKGKLANSETSCASLKSFNSSLEENLAQMVKHNEDTKKYVETELQNKDKWQAQAAKLQKVNTQLRSLVLKYKAEISSLTSADKKESDAASAGASSTASAQLEEENKRLVAEIERFKQENEMLQKNSNETDEKAKKIAKQAKQRISEMTMEKASLTREKDTLAKEIQALKAHIFQLQSNDEQRLAYCDQLKSDYEARLGEQERLIESLNLQISEQQMIVASAAASTAPSFVSSDTPATSAAPQSVSPLQNMPTTVSSVNPQATPLPLATKTTPTASIKPLIDANAAKAASQRAISRPVTVVQPTANAEESTTSGALINQTSGGIMATVQPAQPEAAVSTASSVSSTCVPSSIEVSEASTSGNLNVDSISSAVPSTSTGFAGYSAAEDNNKRTLDDASDEPSTSSNLKKFKSTEEESYGDEEYDSDEQGEDLEDEDEEMNESGEEGGDDEEEGYDGGFQEGDEKREEEEDEEEEPDGDVHEASEPEDEYDESSSSSNEDDNDSVIEVIDIDDDDDKEPQVSGNNAPREEVSSSFVSRPGPSNSNNSDDDNDADANESND